MRPSLALFLLVAWGLVGCRASSEGLVVVAASSLAQPIAELEPLFENAHPAVDVRASFAGSHTLAAQLRQGLDADVFASADPVHLAALADDGLAQPPRAFASGGLVLVLAKDAPVVEIETLDSVGSLVIGTPSAPIGVYTERLLDGGEGAFGRPWREAVEARVVSREPNVQRVAAKVGLGEADAAIVYRSVGRAMAEVRVVELPGVLNPTVTWMHAELVGADDAATAWMEHVESPEGQAVLARRGFGPP